MLMNCSCFLLLIIFDLLYCDFSFYLFFPLLGHTPSLRTSNHILTLTFNSSSLSWLLLVIPAVALNKYLTCTAGTLVLHQNMVSA